MQPASGDYAVGALKVWAVEIDLGEHVYRIPPLPAQDWFLAVLLDDNPLPIVPGMLEPADHDQVLDALLEGELNLEDVIIANREALEAASGWRWWEADRLIRSAGAEWRDIGGALSSRGVDLAQVSLGAALNAIYSLAIRNLDEQKRFTFLARLSSPPPGEIARTYDESAYADAFEDAMNEAQRGAPPYSAQ